MDAARGDVPRLEVSEQMTADSDFRRRAGGDHCRSRRWCWGALIAVQVRSHPWVVAADMRIMRHVTPSGERQEGSERMVVCAAWSRRTARTGGLSAACVAGPLFRVRPRGAGERGATGTVTQWSLKTAARLGMVTRGRVGTSSAIPREEAPAVGGLKLRGRKDRALATFQNAPMRVWRADRSGK